MDDEALGKLARRQWGVFTYRQALAAGANKWLIRRRVDGLDWAVVERHVYRFRGGHESWHQKVVAATLALGPGAFASHRTAAFLWGLGDTTPPGLIEVTAPFRSSLLLTFTKVHHTRRPSERPVWRDRIPTTPMARTLVDLADVLDDETLFIAFDSARRKRRTLLEELAVELRANGAGRSGAELAKMISRARGEPATDSELEARAAFAIDRFRLPRPTRQLVVRSPAGDFIAKVDFAWPSQRVIVQCDSHEFHLTPDAFEKDLRQRRQLESHQWRVIHVTRRMLRNDDWLRDLARLLASQEQAKAG